MARRLLLLGALALSAADAGATGRGALARFAGTARRTVLSALPAWLDCTRPSQLQPID